MLKFFADECINIDIVLALRQNSFDVLTVRDAGLVGVDDDAVFNFARDNKRILLTFDRGFGDIFRFDISKSSGVIVILMSQMSRDEIIEITSKFISLIQKQGFNGKLAIIGKTRIRISER